jgi:DNA-binding response OmpR family regulator
LESQNVIACNVPPQFIFVGEHPALDFANTFVPTMNGLEILTALRAKKIQTHVLFLTARDSVDDRVRGLRAGADDYLVKPFALTEFLARVEALCRRSYEHKSPYVEINNLRIELDSLQATVSGQKLDLLPREFRILQLLMLRPGKVLTRSYIEDHIYDENKELMSNVVESAISHLRKKLAQAGSHARIETKRGFGYYLDVSPSA